MAKSYRPDLIICDDYANICKGALDMGYYNGTLRIILQLEGKNVIREEEISINTEKMLQLGGLRDEISIYKMGQSWPPELREKYRKLIFARTAFAKEVSDEVASAIISAFECTDHKLVQPASETEGD